MNENKPYCNPTWDGSKFQLSSGNLNIHSIEVDNVVAVDYWLQIFDGATGDVILGTTAPDQSYLLAAGDATLHGQVVKEFNAPLSLVKGACFAVTTTPSGASVPGGKVFPISIKYRRVRQGQS